MIKPDWLVKFLFGLVTVTFDLIEFLVSVYGSTVLLLDLGRFFSYLIVYTVGRTPWTGDQPVARPLPTQTSMP
jgi:hypothetical protein